MSGPLFNDFMKSRRLINEMPPVPRCILAHKRVPFGRAYRQWNTRGELIVWCNWFEIKRMVYMAPRERKFSPEAGMLSMPISGITVYFIDDVRQINV